MAKYRNKISGAVSEVDDHIAAIPAVAEILEPVIVEGCIDCELPAIVTPIEDNGDDKPQKKKTITKKDDE